jgi:DNA repair exonuclease SbcCD ATPase subunit
MHSLYKEVTREVNKLERKLRENDLELTNAKKDNERNMNNLKEKNKRYNDDNNKLYNKLSNMQEELNYIKEENESLKSQNKSLTNDNESMLNENKNNNDAISEYKKIIEKLKKENNDLKNTLKSRKYNVSTQSKNSDYADEIVIVNKETTYSKGLFDEPNEFNKYGQIKNRYEIKRNVNSKSDELLKYHEIIQDLSNMILIYEKFFFKDKVKPKNNRELFCYLLIQYINEKFRKIKTNVFMNLLFYNNNNENNGNNERNKTNTYLRRNNSNLGSSYNNINSYTERGSSRKRAYFTVKNRMNDKNY